MAEHLEWQDVKNLIVSRQVPTTTTAQIGKFGKVLISAILEQFYGYTIPVPKLRFKITANLKSTWNRHSSSGNRRSRHNCRSLLRRVQVAGYSHFHRYPIARTRTTDFSCIRHLHADSAGYDRNGYFLTQPLLGKSSGLWGNFARTHSACNSYQSPSAAYRYAFQRTWCGRGA